GRIRWTLRQKQVRGEGGNRDRLLDEAAPAVLGRGQGNRRATPRGYGSLRRRAFGDRAAGRAGAVGNTEKTGRSPVVGSWTGSVAAYVANFPRRTMGVIFAHPWHHFPNAL